MAIPPRGAGATSQGDSGSADPSAPSAAPSAARVLRVCLLPLAAVRFLLDRIRLHLLLLLLPFRREHGLAERPQWLHSAHAAGSSAEDDSSSSGSKSGGSRVARAGSGSTSAQRASAPPRLASANAPASPPTLRSALDAASGSAYARDAGNLATGTPNAAATPAISSWVTRRSSGDRRHAIPRGGSTRARRAPSRAPSAPARPRTPRGP